MRQGHSRQNKIVHPYENSFLYLKKLLGLEKRRDEFIKVKAALKRFSRRHLDPDRKVHQQRDSFNFLLNKLVDAYPELYKGEEERLRYAGDIIVSIHDRKQEGRWKLTSPEVLDLTQPAVVLSDSNSGAPNKNVQGTRKKAPTLSQRKFGKEGHASSDAAAPRGSQIGKVHKFLTSCDPPMGWCLFLFVESGWLSEDRLRAVASWSHTRRHALLKKILAGPDGQRAVADIDIAILERQFRDYFTM